MIQRVFKNFLSTKFVLLLTTLTLLYPLTLSQSIEVRKADMLSKDYQYCKIFQGDKLTMMSCLDSHELYLTDKLATNWHMNLYIGDISKPVYCTRNSLEKKHPGAITYIEEINKVKRAYVNSQDEIVIETVMELTGIDSDLETPDGMWVFDTVVIVRQKGSGTFVFFQKPIIRGFISNPMPTNVTSNAVDGALQYEIGLLGSGWIQSKLSQNEFTLYGIKDQYLMMYFFVFDPNTKTISVTGNGNTKMHSELTGTLYTSFFSRDFWVIACADCAMQGFVNFYNLQSLDSIEQVVFTKMNTPYQLAGYQDLSSLNKFQLFIAGGDYIDMIEFYDDYYTEESYFRLTTKLWTNPKPVQIDEAPAGAPYIFVAKSRDYLSFKVVTEKSIYMMATCDYHENFNSANFTCDVCPAFLRSWGMQAEECIPCGQMLVEHDNDDIKKAMYQTICTDGQTKSWTVMVFSALLFVILATTLCMVNQGQCNKMEEFVDFSKSESTIVPKCKDETRKSIHGEAIEEELIEIALEKQKNYRMTGLPGRQSMRMSMRQSESQQPQDKNKDSRLTETKKAEIKQKIEQNPDDVEANRYQRTDSDEEQENPNDHSNMQ